ncbi:MAG: MucB/RseB C-terminal domain-containing protein [Burkholderiales bacterium]|jgi:sigma-E factor negative regulatory protein RseB
MPAHVRRWFPLLALVSQLVPAGAGAAPGDAGVAAALDDARSFLLRIQQAANTGNYRGTMVFSANGSMSSSRVLHYWIGEQTYEKMESLDGRQQQVYRHNDDVHTIWPQTREAVVEKRGPRGGWQATPSTIEPSLLDQYQLRREGPSRIAGRDADVLLLDPRDALRYAQRVWADRATGLMLRADVLGPDKLGVLESVGFSEVEIGVKPEPRAVTRIVSSLDGFRIVKPTQQSTRLDDEGWTLARPIAGFKLVGCVKRQFDAIRSAAVSVEPMLQAVFSDGLAHVSLFIETYDKRRHKNEIVAHLGATTTVTVRRQDHWFTAVGDAPPATLKLFTDALDRRR